MQNTAGREKNTTRSYLGITVFLFLFICIGNIKCATTAMLKYIHKYFGGNRKSNKSR